VTQECRALPDLPVLRDQPEQTEPPERPVCQETPEIRVWRELLALRDYVEAVAIAEKPDLRAQRATRALVVPPECRGRPEQPGREEVTADLDLPGFRD